MLDHPYASLLPHVERPGRYLGGEFGCASPKPGARARIALCFPDLYEVGMSHIGLAVLYEAVNRIPGLAAERVFMPWPDMEAAIRGRGLPLLSLESATPLHRFDAVGFSLQYELTYTNLLAMLDLGGIPRRAERRGPDSPIVIAGGPLAFQCEPLAPFLDVVVLGDGEEALPALLTRLAEARAAGASREERIAAICELPFAFSPSRLERAPDPASGRLVVTGPALPAARRAFLADLGAQPPGAGPVPSVGAVFDRYSLEIARGCTEGCRFCQAGFLYRPTRQRDEHQALAAAERAVGELGYDEISLAALSSADHGRIEPLLHLLGERLTPRRVSLAVPSLRAYGLADGLIEIVGRLRASGVTLAPEAGSRRLRELVNKNVTEDDLFAAAARFFDRGFDRIKLYFMIGLPDETDEDVLAIADLAARLQRLGRERRGGGRPTVTASVSNFVPKPHTPFETEPMIPLHEIERRQRLLAAAGREARVEVRLHDARLSRLEGIFSRGDASLADVLEAAVDRGARFDGWTEMFRPGIWDELLPDDAAAHWLEAIPDGARVPWDHVDVGVSREFLAAERALAHAGRATRPCGRFLDPADPGGGPETFVCHACGLGCRSSDLPARPGRMPPAPPGPPPRRAPGKPRPHAADEPRATKVERVRLVFAKWGRQAWVGHLDTVRLLSRALRRADLELDYSRGFHPKPRLELAPPLPLGTAGLDEPLDVWLVQPPPKEEILARLSGALPAEMAIRSVALPGSGAGSLSRCLDRAEYMALIEADAGAMRSAVRALLAGERFEIDHVRKGRSRRVDVRPVILDAAVLDAPPTGLPLPDPASRIALSFTLKFLPSGGARPSDLLRALCGEDAAAAAWIIRTKVVLSEAAAG
ncbi:MAG TPA: TIGR03960 family B12-binding radical SAM protein [Polyangia bacterium]|nr:TIGR03960 family B12-binding radical SAM protein [Polyangia bacterium]